MNKWIRTKILNSLKKVILTLVYIDFLVNTALWYESKLDFACPIFAFTDFRWTADLLNWLDKGSKPLDSGLWNRSRSWESWSSRIFKESESELVLYFYNYYYISDKFLIIIISYIIPKFFEKEYLINNYCDI